MTHNVSLCVFISGITPLILTVKAATRRWLCSTNRVFSMWSSSVWTVTCATWNWPYLLVGFFFLVRVLSAYVHLQSPSILSKYQDTEFSLSWHRSCWHKSDCTPKQYWQSDPHQCQIVTWLLTSLLGQFNRQVRLQEVTVNPLDRTRLAFSYRFKSLC